MDKAVGYLRCSGFGDGTDTWDRQLDSIRRFADSKGYELMRDYREDAVPGKLDREDRPAFQQMITDLADNGCKTIIIERLDRLARRYRTQESLITYIYGEGLVLFAADTGENITDAMMGDPMRRALVQIQGIFSELDKNMLIAKLSKARKRLRDENGKCEGRIAYGKKPGEELVLATILSLSGQCKMSDDIAAYLNREGVKTRYGKEWKGSTIRKILNRHDDEQQIAKQCA